MTLFCLFDRIQARNLARDYKARAEPLAYSRFPRPSTIEKRRRQIGRVYIRKSGDFSTPLVTANVIAGDKTQTSERRRAQIFAL